MGGGDSNLRRVISYSDPVSPDFPHSLMESVGRNNLK